MIVGHVRLIQKYPAHGKCRVAGEIILCYHWLLNLLSVFMLLPTLKKIAPDFILLDQNGEEHSLKQYRGKWVILYFYPKDDTPGCTVEACSFRDNFTALKRAGINVLGVSTDPIKKHAKFVEKYELPFTLLSDEAKQVVKLYGVWGKKKFMGREYMGTNRVSFLIDPKGKLVKIYDPVKPAEHVAEVLADVKNLNKQ